MIGGVVLAAGASTRAGTIKALVPIDEETFVARAIRALREGGCDEVVVVVGPPHAERVAAAIGDAARVDNPRPERGMLSSLKLGLSDDWDAAIVSLVDHPRVSPSTVRVLIEAWRRGDAEVLRPRHEGESGHPILIARTVFAALRLADDAAGARPVLASRRRDDVDVDDPFIHEDLDTKDAIRRS